MAKDLMIANWKMNKSVKETEKFVGDFVKHVKDVEGVDMVICPPFTALHAASDAINDANIKLGAQDMYCEDHGAFTGEISPKMVGEFCHYVIVGHSERRHLFGESNDLINKKVRAALDNSLIPILCIGENLEEREAKNTKNVLEHQLKSCLKGVSKDDAHKIVIAYEPIWAISSSGPGKVATIAQIDEAMSYINHVLDTLFGEEIEKKMRVIYGGSVTHENVAELMKKDSVEGCLVGHDSLSAKDFATIVKFRELIEAEKESVEKVEKEKTE